MKKLLILVAAMSVMEIAYANQSWTGFYAGASGGLVFNDLQLRSHQLAFTNENSACQINSDFSTLSSGVQLGYMHQFANSVVAGIETNFLFNSYQKNSLRCNSNINASVYDGFTFQNKMYS